MPLGGQLNPYMYFSSFLTRIHQFFRPSHFHCAPGINLQMSSKKHSFERRTDKLRASCDACYLAKVKCSKSRPLCQRCLVSGTNCSYSPSARFKRGPKTNGTDRMNEDTITFRSQTRSEADIEYNPSMMAHMVPPGYSNYPFLSPNERYPTPASAPCPGNWTPDLLVCAEPVVLFDGDAASELFPDVDGFELSDPCSWWSYTSPTASSAADNGLNDNFTQLESTEIPLPFCYSSWSRSPMSGTNQLPSNNLNMAFTPSAITGTNVELDYSTFGVSGQIPDAQIPPLKESNAALQFNSRGQ